MSRLILVLIFLSSVLLSKADQKKAPEAMPKNLGAYSGPCHKLATPKSLDELFQKGKKKSFSGKKKLSGSRKEVDSIFDECSAIQLQGQAITIYKGKYGYRTCMTDKEVSECGLPTKNEYLDASFGFESPECYQIRHIKGDRIIRIELCPNETQYSWQKKSPGSSEYFQRTEIYSETGIRVQQRSGKGGVLEEKVANTEAWGINHEKIPKEFRQKDFFCYYAD